MILNVVCIKAGEKYGSEYVNRLAAGVGRWTTRAPRVVCLTEDPRGIRDDVAVLPLEEHGLHGWWHKLTLFKPPAGLEERRIIFLDLDVVLTGPLDFLFDYDGRLGILRDFYQSDKYNSSVMSIAPGAGLHIWEWFQKWGPRRVMESYYGDQEWITEVCHWADIWQALAPGKIASYKADNLTAGPNGASIAVFHGEPKPHEFKEGWVYDAWV